MQLLVIMLVGLCFERTIQTDLDIDPQGDLANVDIAMDMCSMDPCPEAQECVNVAGLGFLCRCPVNFVGISCSTECQSSKADIAFLLDSSSSLTEDDWINTLYFVSYMILQLQVDEGVHRIAIITFGDKAVIEFGLDTYSTKQYILDRVRDLEFRQEMTNTSGAIWRMREQIFQTRSSATPIGIIITDGASNVDRHLTIEEARLAKESGIVMFAIGVSDEIVLEELESIASRPTSRHMYRVSDFGMLSALTNTILERTCDLMPQYQRGPSGATGSIGPDGVGGPRGPVGEPGFTGSTGRRGQRGFPGDIGEKGQIGATGDSTRHGRTGADGRSGVTGSTGHTGQQGLKGDAGDRGDTIIGFPGQAGIRGSIGWPGPEGFQGVIGVKGFQGSTGWTGVMGLEGFPGSVGEVGSPGLSGDRGSPGPKGPTGRQGAVGPIGYVYEDGDECSFNVSLCQHVCINKRQGYECRCLQGYDLQADGHRCRDIDECLDHNGGCEQFCHNTEGSYSCSCTTGFTLSPDTKTCMDVDECCSDFWPNPCLKTHECLNTLGSYFCVHKSLVRDPNAPIFAKPHRTKADSVFMKRAIIIGLLVWLGALTILTIICVVLASSLQRRNPIVKTIEAEFVREVSYLNGEERRVFPRLSLASRPVPDNSMQEQEDMRSNLGAGGVPAVNVDRPGGSVRSTVPRSEL